MRACTNREKASQGPNLGGVCAAEQSGLSGGQGWGVSVGKERSRISEAAAVQGRAWGAPDPKRDPAEAGPQRMGAASGGTAKAWARPRKWARKPGRGPARATANLWHTHSRKDTSQR